MKFSKAWEGNEGVKIRDLKKKPDHTPQPLKAGKQKDELSYFGDTRKDDK